MAEGRPRVHKYRTSGVMDKGSDPLVQAELGLSVGAGWPEPEWVADVTATNARFRRRFFWWGVSVVAAIAVTCAAQVLFLINGDQGLRDTVIEVVWWAVLAITVGWALLAVVQGVTARLRGTARRPCVHCGLTIDGRDERCRFCGWSQVPEPEPEPEAEPESSRDDANWPWSPPPALCATARTTGRSALDSNPVAPFGRSSGSPTSSRKR